jgi:hypothetical protein
MDKEMLLAQLKEKGGLVHVWTSEPESIAFTIRMIKKAQGRFKNEYSILKGLVLYQDGREVEEVIPVNQSFQTQMETLELEESETILIHYRGVKEGINFPEFSSFFIEVMEYKTPEKEKKIKAKLEKLELEKQEKAKKEAEEKKAKKTSSPIKKSEKPKAEPKK